MESLRLPWKHEVRAAALIQFPQTKQKTMGKGAHPDETTTNINQWPMCIGPNLTHQEAQVQNSKRQI